MYITIADVRAEGVTLPMADDAKITATIAMWQQFIESQTGQWFESRSLTLLLDGTDSDTLFLPVPAISISALYINNDFVNALAAATYSLYLGTFPDYRRNPRVKLVSVDQENIFMPPPGRGRLRASFIYGKQNQKMVGAFGFVEADGTTPLMIKRALLKLVVSKVTPLAGAGSGSSSAAGPVTTEMTDGHMRVYSTLVKASVKPGSNPITGDSEVDAILAMYKRPIAVGVPLSSMWEAG